MKLGAILTVTALSINVADGASFNEFVDGDLSGIASTPTLLILDSGANYLLAEASVSDNDLLKITVPPNHTLNSIVVEFHDDVNPVFAGLQLGPTWSAGLDTEIDPGIMLGWTEFPLDPNQPHVGQDILNDIGLGAGASGFTAPLSSGTYTFLFSAPSAANRFALSFNVASTNPNVPGDFNGDRAVDALDLAHWRQSFSLDGNSDADSDGDSDGGDFLIWQRNFGRSAAPAVATVPEPRGFPLVLTAIGVIGGKRRRNSTTSR